MSATAKAPAAPPDPKAMHEAWMRTATLGEHHRLLEPFAGVWTSRTRAWFMPGQPPSESQGRMVITWVLDGRYLRQEYQGHAGPMTMKGIGYWGHDNATGRFVGTWMDTMSTVMMSSTGSYDAASKTFTMRGTFHDPMGGAYVFRQIIRLIDNDHHTFEMHQTGPDGNEKQSLEIAYTRAV